VTNVICATKFVIRYIFSEIRVASPPAPLLAFLISIVYEHLPQILLTSNPRFVLQYIISVLLQLNIESSNAHLDDAINSRQHQLNRTLVRENLLDTLNSSVHLTSLQLVQQMAFVLYLITVSILLVIVCFGLAYCVTYDFISCQLSTIAVKKVRIALYKNPSQSYGASLAIWDQPGRYSTYLPRRDGRLS